MAVGYMDGRMGASKPLHPHHPKKAIPKTNAPIPRVQLHARLRDDPVHDLVGPAGGGEDQGRVPVPVRGLVKEAGCDVGVACGGAGASVGPVDCMMGSRL